MYFKAVASRPPILSQSIEVLQATIIRPPKAFTKPKAEATFRLTSIRVSIPSEFKAGLANRARERLRCGF
jgi:hypothetical protein